MRVARNREPGVTLEQIAADFGVHPITLSKWLRRTDTDEGARPATAIGESAELRAGEGQTRMGTVLLVASAAAVAAVVVTGFWYAPDGEKLRKGRLGSPKKHGGRRAGRWRWSGRWTTASSRSTPSQLCRRDGCTESKRVGGLAIRSRRDRPSARRTKDCHSVRYAKHRTVGSRDIQTFNGADVPVFVASTVPARR